MKTRNLLYCDDVAVNDHIHIKIPSVGVILEDEDAYYSIVNWLTAMPIDMMVQLDDIGIDFSKIDEYDLFLLMFSTMKDADTSLVFGDLDLSKFEYCANTENGQIVLIDTQNDIRIDRLIHNSIAETLRKIHHLEKNIRKPGNEEARKFMIDRARKKMKRNRNKVVDSQLETLIIAMVNTEQYKYDFEGTRELSIYQFNESVRQIIKKVEYDNRMHGVYSGTINVADLSQDDLNWLTHK